MKRLKKDDRSAFDAFQATVATVVRGDWSPVHTLKVSRTVSKMTTHGSDGGFVSYEVFVATKVQFVVDSMMAGGMAIGNPELLERHNVPWPYSHIWMAATEKVGWMNTTNEELKKEVELRGDDALAAVGDFDEEFDRLRSADHRTVLPTPQAASIAPSVSESGVSNITADDSGKESTPRSSKPNQQRPF